MFKCTYIKTVPSEFSVTLTAKMPQFSNLCLPVKWFLLKTDATPRNKSRKTIHPMTRGKSKKRLELQVSLSLLRLPGYIFRTSCTDNRNGNFLHSTKQEALSLLFCCQLYKPEDFLQTTVPPKQETKGYSSWKAISRVH